MKWFDKHTFYVLYDILVASDIPNWWWIWGLVFRSGSLFKKNMQFTLKTLAHSPRWYNSLQFNLLVCHTIKFICLNLLFCSYWFYSVATGKYFPKPTIHRHYFHRYFKTFFNKYIYQISFLKLYLWFGLNLKIVFNNNQK